MKKSLLVFLLFLPIIFNSCKTDEFKEQPKVICNPLNLSYRFRPETNEPSRREAADPTMVVFRGEYFLFASKTGGYWHSSDLVNWHLVETNQIPTEDYAPSAFVMNGAVYFMASNSKNCPILKSTDPKTGNWEVVCDTFPLAVTDPAFFPDDDNRLYFYWECSNYKPIMGVELDPKTFMPIGEPDSLIFANTAQNGWENPGDYNELNQQAPWLEGAWMIKYNGRYYLQYASPGTEFKSYNDAVYISDSPLGEYQQAKHNPMAFKPEGFINGIGHGCTFIDLYGNYWHVGTMSVSVKHPFERRLGLNPVFFDAEGNMYASTERGDFPFIIPEKKIESPQELETGWILLSYKKPVEASSQLFEHPAENAVNEDVRTYWSAQNGKSDEWLSVDLENNFLVKAVQVNFAEHNARVYGREPGIKYQYLLEYSRDGKKWEVLVNKSENSTDTPHDFINLTNPVNARYLRIVNFRVPSGNFAISGFRIFGKGSGIKPVAPAGFQAARETDRRVVNLQWDKSPGAFMYKILFGYDSNHMYLSHLVYGNNFVTFRSLNSNSAYEFQVVAINENGESVPSQKVCID
jgi:xylan 1,4-beta-xylosidase